MNPLGGIETTSNLAGDQPVTEPRVLGESTYDQITSFLIAVVLGAILVVGWLGLVYITNQAYAARVTAPLQIIEVSGGPGGGSSEGTPGSSEKIDIAGAEAAALASNNQEEAGDFEEPSVQQAPGAMLDAAAEAGESMAEVDLGAIMPSGGAVASGKRASRLGTGGPGLGFGPGDGFGREQRWSIIFDDQQTIDEYARQLDALHVQLGVVTGSSQIAYVSDFSSPRPSVTYGTGRSDSRLYFLWQGRGRKASDIALLQKGGIDVGDRVVLQFYPREAEERLALLERRYRGRQPSEIRVTRFAVVRAGGGYDFKVLAQETLR
jgi:hypothetical protein